MKISIITPNYNYAKYISQTIESIVSQDYDNYEHIIVDDGSTDNSVEIIKSYQRKYPDKIKLIIQENKGQTPAINTGLKSATGDIIGWINSDDTYCKGIFNKINTIFQNNDKLDIIIGNVNVVDLEGNFIYKIRHNSYDFMAGAKLGFMKITTSNAVFWKKTLMDKVGFMDDKLKCNMDGEYFSRLFLDSVVHQINDSIANFRKQEISIAALKEKNWRTNFVDKEVEFEKLMSAKRIEDRHSDKAFTIKSNIFYLKIQRILEKIYKLYYFREFYEKIIYRIKTKNKIKNM